MDLDIYISCPERTFKNAQIICQLNVTSFNETPSININFGDGDTRTIEVSGITTNLIKSYSLSSIFNISISILTDVIQYSININGMKF